MKKKALFAMGLGLCLLLTACGESNPKPAANSSIPTSSTISSDTSLDAQEEQNGIIGILGSSIRDVRISLEQAGGIPKGEISPTLDNVNGEFMSSSTYEIPVTGITLDYSLTGDSNYQITTSVFGLTSTKIATNESILSFAEEFLGYCATIPYDSADTEAARQWLTDNLNDYANQPSTTIGDATFTLNGAADEDGSIVFLSLGIRKNNLDEQIIANMENE